MRGWRTKMEMVRIAIRGVSGYGPVDEAYI